MGGQNSQAFKQFVHLCKRAYNVLRHHVNELITLFVTMVSGGIQQLATVEDLHYLREALSPELSDDKASEKFENLIQINMANRLVSYNNAIHELAKKV